MDTEQLSLWSGELGDLPNYVEEAWDQLTLAFIDINPEKE